MIATSCATSCYCFCCWYHLPTYLPIHGLTLLSVLEENWIKLTKIDRSFAAMAQQIALRHNYHVSQYQLLPEAGWGSLAGNLATRNCDNIYSKNPCEASYGLQHAQVLYLFYHCVIVSSIPSRYHMTWRTVWCLFFTALIGRWLGLGFARMLFLHVLGIMLSLCSWRHLELRHCSQKHIKRWLQYHKLSPLSKINVAVRYRFKQQHLMGHRVFQS